MTKEIRGIKILRHNIPSNEDAQRTMFEHLLTNYQNFLIPEEPGLFTYVRNAELFAKYAQQIKPNGINVVSGTYRPTEDPIINYPKNNYYYWENYWAYALTAVHIFTKKLKGNYIDNLFLYIVGGERPHRNYLEKIIKDQYLTYFGISSTRWSLQGFKKAAVELPPEMGPLLQDYEQETPRLPTATKNIKMFYPLYSSLINIVSCNDISYCNYDEKFYRSILHNMFFIGVGPQHWHAGVKELGFKLPDFIDYSFDALENMEDRCEGIVKNLHNLKDKNLNELHGDYSHILKHNFERLCDMILSGEGIPDLCRENKHYSKLIDLAQQKITNVLKHQQ